jgi:hypothetical protein
MAARYSPTPSPTATATPTVTPAPDSNVLFIGRFEYWLMIQPSNGILFLLNISLITAIPPLCPSLLKLYKQVH